MSYIKNLIKEPELKRKPKDDDIFEDSNETSKESKRPIVRTVTDLQRLRLEKLMKNPEKPVIIPDMRGPRAPKESDAPPAFVRNVMGSSAGAGSGEFHVYRHLRRKEYARQKNIQIKSYNEQLDKEYQDKLEENRRIAEEKTAKKRSKRLKKKQRAKQARKVIDNKKQVQNIMEESSSNDESDSGKIDQEQMLGNSSNASDVLKDVADRDSKEIAEEDSKNLADADSKHIAGKDLMEIANVKSKNISDDLKKICNVNLEDNV